MAQACSITSAAAWALMEALRRRGQPIEALVELAGLDPALPPSAEHHLSAETYYALWDRAMQQVQDPRFPVEVGASFEIESLEVFGFLALSCHTLGDAYERTARVRALYNLGASWELEREAETMRLRWCAWPIKVRSELARRSVDEYQVAEMLSSIRQMTGRALVPRRVVFTHSAPRDVSAHRELFGIMPSFDGEFVGLEADLSWLGEPLGATNPRFRGYFERQCEAAARAFASDPAFTAVVRQRVAANMEGGAISVGAVARSLGLSPRSLQRRLTEEGTRYSELVDQVRRQFAEQYLARPRLAVSEVAYLVGFTEPSAFFKAFRRWTGLTPNDYRRQALEAGGP